MIHARAAVGRNIKNAAEHNPYFLEKLCLSGKEGLMVVYCSNEAAGRLFQGTSEKRE